MHFSARSVLYTEHPTLPEMTLSSGNMFKYAVDRLGALALIIALSPLFLLLIGWLHFSGQKIFYSQRRVGKDGAPFSCYKFCTMVQDAEEKLQYLLEVDPEIAREWKQHRKITNDPRVTAAGRFLRRTSLDELPQLFNVLKGEMSLVGPRPVVRDELIEHYGSNAAYYKSIRPGITGLWQVNGRSLTTYHSRVKLDCYYAQHHHFWMDVAILLKTVKVVLLKHGAH